MAPVDLRLAHWVLGSDLQEVVRECEGKYLRKRGLLKEVQKMLSDGDVDRHLTRIHQKLQNAYSKWMVRVVTFMAVRLAEALTTRLSLNCGQMRKLEHWGLVFRRWKTK